MESELVGLISGSVSGLSGRIYPLVLPQGSTLPSCVYQRITTNPEHSRDNAVNLELNRVQFTVYAQTYGSARTQADAIKALLLGYENNDGEVISSFIDNQFDDIEEETQLRKSVVDVLYLGRVS